MNERPAIRYVQIPTPTGEEHKWAWFLVSEDGKMVAASRRTFLSKKDCKEHIIFMMKNMRLTREGKAFTFSDPELKPDEILRIEYRKVLKELEA